ncbi:phosphoserine phosphatase SerB [Brachybacterium halotolerans subsp. kimchii]|uniref:phosphoserine phosphatase SerB n=1 Tax=Brachybacterium halotolerans TaxID=2795215 RepID=UPI001E568C62|nr:phosphoserine phosphatase SerB [Brachybacterium halotolerans]UEJ83191.1 phosphoserine phosphatase SerB [Brachybacterium halotolerans subsp. kimchii]
MNESPEIPTTPSAPADQGPDQHAPARALLVSDVDSTFLTQEVIELVAEHAGTRAQVAEVTTRAMRGEMDFTQSLHARVATLAGLPVSVLAEVRAALVPTPGALELVERCRAAGVVTALVSGGFHEAIDELAASAGIDHVLANRFEIRDGRLTGGVSGPIVDAQTKRRTLEELAARHGVPIERTVAVGDGANDAPMVRAAGIGIAFRGKPALVEVADVHLEGESLLDVWPHLERVLERA